ncbi:hypothetical protein UFOVP447_4 [uncultured Caudovirales phage]|uniref:Uncharacterized protein n=1 Tax=uncultured Caudovirales phage TaxID=2100421 RepID=A0A6J5MF97_9CAUD|nr:hypothetical protein UFOVP447_4 [uncultured Caudovirales phage]
MDIRVFDLPTRYDDPYTIERRLRELEERARHGVELDEVEINWMDTANTWLIAEWSKV